MISTPTVLVLGAGASMHLKYPSGRELVDWIVKNLSTRSKHQLYLSSGFTDSDIKSFKDALFYSGRPSVDAFLEHRKEFIEIGKLAIAQYLIPKEHQGELFQAKDNWYEYLFKRLNAPFDEFSKNTLSIITFNYDRSLDTYLFTALKNSYGRGDGEVSKVISQIPIIHVYGQLGNLPWQHSDGRKYQLTEDIEEIRKSANDLKIISEDIELEKDKEFIHAHKVLDDAKLILFLGFGYDDTNMKRLKIRWDTSSNRIIRGSCYGFSVLESRQLRALYESRLQLGRTQENVLMFLREHTSLV